MKFSTVLVALMAASTAFAAPAHFGKGAGAKAVSSKTAGKGSNNAASSSSTSNSTSTGTSTSSDNSTSTSDNSSSSNATSTSTAASATRTRPCDQGDQSLAAGLTAAVSISIGQQASILTLQNISSQAQFSASDFSDGVTRLQQFVSTMALQLQMAQGIADDDSFAQTQLKLLADAQQTQSDTVNSLANISTAADATAAAGTLNTLLQSFLDNTNNALDGAEQALIDCTLPLTAVSG